MKHLKTYESFLEVENFNEENLTSFIKKLRVEQIGVEKFCYYYNKSIVFTLFLSKTKGQNTIRFHLIFWDFLSHLNLYKVDTDDATIVSDEDYIRHFCDVFEQLNDIKIDNIFIDIFKQSSKRLTKQVDRRK